MPSHECLITDEELGYLVDPSEDPDFINNNYEQPSGARQSWLQVRVYSDPDTYHEFNRHYVSKSYSDEWLWASRSTGKLQFNDGHRTRPNLPCKLVAEQKIIIKDLNGIRTLGYWFVRGNPVKKPYGKRRPDGTYPCLIDVELQDCWSMMEARTYSANYNDHAGAILADAFTRAGFDASAIDVTAGPIIEHQVVDDFPSATAEQMMNYLDWSYWFDIQYDPPKPYAGPKESELVRIDFEINESNWDKIFAPDDSGEIEFELQPANEDYANEVLLTYRRKYNKGKATFQNGSNVMLGYTGEEDWYQINLLDSQSSADVEIPSTGATYRLNKNNSVAPGPANTPPQVAEFILGSEYAQADTVGGVDYVIKGINNKISRRNSQAVARMAALRGGDGIRSKVIVRNDAAMTYAEASVVATFELSLYSREYYRGHGVIPTSYHADWLLFWPGRTLPINLPDSKGIVAFLRIEGMRRADLGSPQTFSDGSKCVALSNELQFTPSLYVDTEQIRAIFRSQRKVAAVSSEAVSDTEFVENILAIKDCTHILDNITELDASEYELENSVNVLDYPSELASTDYSMTFHPGYVSVTTG